MHSGGQGIAAVSVAVTIACLAMCHCKKLTLVPMFLQSAVCFCRGCWQLCVELDGVNKEHCSWYTDILLRLAIVPWQTSSGSPSINGNFCSSTVSYIPWSGLAGTSSPIPQSHIASWSDSPISYVRVHSIWDQLSKNNSYTYFSP